MIVLPVEFGSSITIVLTGGGVLASAELTEIFGSFGDDIIIELEDDTAGIRAVNFDIELCKMGSMQAPRIRSMPAMGADKGANRQT